MVCNVRNWIAPDSPSCPKKSRQLGLAVDLRHLHDFEEESKLTQDVGKLVVLDRLYDVMAASELVTRLDLSRVVHSREHDDRDLPQFIVLLDLAEHFHAVDLGNADVEQQEIRGLVFSLTSRAVSEEEVQDFLTG